MIRLAPLSTRNQFGDLLTGRGLVGAAVEVGTHRGDFARVLLGRWPGMLYCVDHWAVPPGYEAQAHCLSALGGAFGDREADLTAAKEVLAPFAGRAVLIREASAEAAARFVQRSLDFVYLDGDHERPGIDEDLRSWWPKIVPGGILAGHDFLCPGPIGRPDDWGRYIQPAVMGFVERQGVDVLLVVEEQNLPWSYVLEKPS